MTTDGAILFDHTTPADNAAFTPAQAARYLVAYHAFALGGRVTFEKGQNGDIFGSADAGPLTKGAPILVQGDTLFQTLMLNLVRYDRTDDEPFTMSPDDLPVWNVLCRPVPKTAFPRLSRFPHLAKPTYSPVSGNWRIR
jgi:CRISPR system Cascade subunit CasA